MNQDGGHNNGKPLPGPTVPKSQEELDQERVDAQEDAQAKVAMMGRAREQARLLILSSAVCTVGASALAWVLAPGPTAWGVTLGCVVMTVNLYALAVLLGKVLLAEENRGIFALLLVGSFLGLAAASAWVVKTYPDMALGFGLGLSVPAVAGMVFGLFRRGSKSG